MGNILSLFFFKIHAPIFAIKYFFWLLTTNKFYQVESSKFSSKFRFALTSIVKLLRKLSKKSKKKLPLKAPQKLVHPWLFLHPQSLSNYARIHWHFRKAEKKKSKQKPKKKTFLCYIFWHRKADGEKFICWSGRNRKMWVVEKFVVFEILKKKKEEELSFQTTQKSLWTMENLFFCVSGFSF